MTYNNIRNAGPLSVSKTLDGNYTEDDREFGYTMTLTSEVLPDAAYKHDYTATLIRLDSESATGTSTSTVNLPYDEDNDQWTFSLIGGDVL